MKHSILLILFVICSFSALAQDSTATKLVFNKRVKAYTVDAACGTCIFKMKGTTCKLAIKWNNQYYFVQGTTIDDHGNAHADDGFCNTSRRALVQGKVKNGKFVATYFKLLNFKKS
ncbi:MAG: DUF6370 family protein [Chitinophagaceae bacterium]|jgi:hypothetical protein|nr:DUF6370 family protein [Chitinophagaceae bacterium]